MSSIIQLLPDHVANQIAAGEVVQRPASVVKELLENSVDAGATDIRLVVKDAGKTLIQVIDNGKGMTPEDAKRCFQRHATSKIRVAEDLFALHTKGFRGEALASIAAIAHVELKTRNAQDELGTQIVIEGSRFISEEPVVHPVGTSFSVKNLFYNIPARRNFLKSDQVEYRHVIDEFQRVALAHPGIAFSLHHNGSEAFQLPVANLRQRIVGILGPRGNERLVPIQEETGIARVHGFIGKPEFAKKGRGEQFFFVNDRYVRNGYLHHAVLAAYEGLLKDGMQPAYFLYLDVPPGSIDINIHPTKTEVKFDDEHALYAILRASAKHSLGQYSVSPVLDFTLDTGMDTPYDYRNRTAETPGIDVDMGFNPFASAGPSKATRATAHYHKDTSAGWEALYSGLTDVEAEPETFASAGAEPQLSSLFDEADEAASALPSYQIHRKYIVNPIKSGMVILDQQRAHQRILYEQFLTGMTVQSAASQQLLFPLELYFSAGDMALLETVLVSLQATGFAFSALERDRIVIEGIPVTMQESETSIVLETLIADMENGLEDSFSQNDRIAKSMARSLAVKTGTLLSPAEQQNLINSLFACRDPQVSPFGKPTFITMRVEDLDKKFTS